jgi:hypothetical protein
MTQRMVAARHRVSLAAEAGIDATDLPQLAYKPPNQGS